MYMSQIGTGIDILKSVLPLIFFAFFIYFIAKSNYLVFNQKNGRYYVLEAKHLILTRRFVEGMKDKRLNVLQAAYFCVIISYIYTRRVSPSPPQFTNWIIACLLEYYIETSELVHSYYPPVENTTCHLYP